MKNKNFIVASVGVLSSANFFARSVESKQLVTEVRQLIGNKYLTKDGPRWHSG